MRNTRARFQVKTYLILSVALVGFLYVLLYRLYVPVDYQAVDTVLLFGSSEAKANLGYGLFWKENVGSTGAVVGTGEASTVRVSLPQVETYFMILRLLPLQSQPERQRIRLLVNGSAVETFELFASKGWQQLSAVIPARFVSPGFNEVRLEYLDVSARESSKDSYAFELLGLRNYRLSFVNFAKFDLHVALPVPQVFLLFKDARAFSRMNDWLGLELLLQFIKCIVIIGVLWYSFSMLLSVSGIDTPKAFRFAIYSYLPGLVFFGIPYTLLLLSPYRLAYSPESFLTVTAGFVALAKVVIYSKAVSDYGRNPVGRAINRLLHLFRELSVSTLVFLGFFVFLVMAAIFLFSGVERIAESLASLAYLLLILGTVVRFFELRR